MNMGRMTVAAVMLAVGFATVGSLEANTLDRRMVTLSVGRVELGGDLKDFSDYLDDIYQFGLSAALPFGSYFSLIAGVERRNIKGQFNDEGDDIKLDLTTTTFSGGARVHLWPAEMITPFISAEYAFTDLELEGRAEGEKIKESDDFKAIVLGGGAEVSLGDRLSLVGTYKHVMPQDSEDDDDRGIVSIALNFWMTGNLLLGGEISQELEDETLIFEVNLGLSF